MNTIDKVNTIQLQLKYIFCTKESFCDFYYGNNILFLETNLTCLHNFGQHARDSATKFYFPRDLLHINLLFIAHEKICSYLDLYDYAH